MSFILTHFNRISNMDIFRVFQILHTKTHIILNPFIPTHHFGATQNHEWKSPSKLLSVEEKYDISQETCIVSFLRICLSSILLSTRLHVQAIYPLDYS